MTGDQTAPLLSASAAAPRCSRCRSPRAAQDRPPGAGGPLAGLTPREFSEFRLGLDDFLEVETAEEGLGPAFNGTSCAVCHNVPAIGGGGLILEVRAGYRDESGEFKTFDPSGETLMHLFSTPTHGCQPGIPAQATIVARRAPIPLFGAGLVEAIPDETLLALEDPADRDRDGISGRAGDRARRRHGRDARRAVRLEGAARDAAHVRRRCLPQRDGDHQRPVPHRSRVRHPPRADPLVRSAPGPGRSRRSARPAAAASTTSRRSCAFSRRCRAGQRVARAGGRTALPARSAARAATCRSCRRDRARARCSTGSPVPAVLRPAAARHRDRRRHPAGRGHGSRDSDAGAVGAAIPAAAAARRQRRHHRRRHPPSRRRGRAARQNFERLSSDTARQSLLAFLNSL